MLHEAVVRLFLLLYKIPALEDRLSLSAPGDRYLSCFHGQMTSPPPLLYSLSGSDFMAEAIRLLG